jgi:hypothetical protein
MLASITPLGEWGRHNSWPLTVSAHIAGSTTAALAAGAVLGAVGEAAGTAQAGAWRLAVLALVLAAALAVELSGRRLPGPHRQVDERWLGEYRGWVYGAGYGVQLGLGLTTVVVSGTVYLAVAAALLCGSPLFGALILGIFGLLRAATVLATAGIDTPERLRELHARLSASARRVARAAVVLELVILTLITLLLLAT